VASPRQTLLPVIAAGAAFTVIVFTVVQPGVVRYVMFVVPAATPVIRPVAALAVAFAVLLLLHAPPVRAFDYVIVRPAQTTSSPVLAPGVGLTVTTLTD
jgi:hypothetical protein